MQEICQSGSEGGAKLTFVPTPILAQGYLLSAIALQQDVGSPQAATNQIATTIFRDCESISAAPPERRA